MAEAYPRFGAFLNATGRHMLYSCSWPDYVNDHINFTTVAQHCNLWRMYRDIYSQWNIVADVIDFMGNEQQVLQPVAGPGGWNDPDQLTVGDTHAQVCRVATVSRRFLSLTAGARCVSDVGCVGV